MSQVRNFFGAKNHCHRETWWNMVKVGPIPCLHHVCTMCTPSHAKSCQKLPLTKKSLFPNQNPSVTRINYENSTQIFSKIYKYQKSPSWSNMVKLGPTFIYHTSQHISCKNYKFHVKNCHSQKSHFSLIKTRLSHELITKTQLKNFQKFPSTKNQSYGQSGSYMHLPPLPTHLMQKLQVSSQKISPSKNTTFP